MDFRSSRLVFLVLVASLSNALVKGEDPDALPGFQNLIKGYNKYLRPNFDGKPVSVAVSMEVASIDAISESNMDYTATIFLRQRWTDERLVFEGNKSFSLDARLVQLLWVPDTYIVDSKRSFLHAITVENRLIRLFANGTVLYAIRITTTVACNMDLAKYPMDKQTCQLQLESWGYTMHDMEYHWLRGNDSVRGMDSLRLSQYTVERYYTLVSKGKYETGEYPRLVLCFELRRNILYFILETYIPSALLVVLSWVSFWLSMASVPARTCIGVTTVLSMTTLMMGSRDSLPTANGVIKAIDVFLGICFSFIFGALLEYAVGHYCAEQMAASKKLKKNMTEELEEITISSVINSSLPSIKRKKSLTLKDPQDGGDGAESDLKKNDNTFKYVLQTKKRISKIINFFSVENPANVDRYSRMVFPLVFLVVNVFYWAYYLYL
ncbi:gamma-aminobutyric acid receptor subunit pi isoform X1 [Ambystoma mexicanum]|uniref:gamma-aminobutyric acid receptor subunit pi isoform X1 n=1 Tax=Ambystoma mexicanum TaxID=8296 RepID=UPI0037E991A1